MRLFFLDIDPGYQGKSSNGSNCISSGLKTAGRDSLLKYVVILFISFNSLQRRRGKSEIFDTCNHSRHCSLFPFLDLSLACNFGITVSKAFSLSKIAFSSKYCTVSGQIQLVNTSTTLFQFENAYSQYLLENIFLLIFIFLFSRCIAPKAPQKIPMKAYHRSSMLSTMTLPPRRDNSSTMIRHYYDY